MTELQVPMLVRLIALILALQQKQFRQDNDGRRESFNSGSESGGMQNVDAQICI